MSLTKPVRVQRKRTKGFKLPPNTVCVNRPLKYGNPWKVIYEKDRWPNYSGWAVYDTRDNSLARGYFEFKSSAMAAAVEEFTNFVMGLKFQTYADLRGKNLACFCPIGQPCHADILLKLANAEPKASFLMV